MTADPLRDAWLQELWPVCRELPREEREAKRDADELARALLPQSVEKAVENVDRGAA